MKDKLKVVMNLKGKAVVRILKNLMKVAGQYILKYLIFFSLGIIGIMKIFILLYVLLQELRSL